MRISVFVNEVMAAHGPYVINILSQEANASVDSFATQAICSYDYYHHI
jgi:endonuclease IV